jgi:lipopolysaccharide export system permease protein
MPWILYRYILLDLLRIIGLTTVILVTVIAFGAAIKPLANDRLLGATQTAKYIALAIVPMLQFALPFAAGFGATMSFYRLTADNEIQAMAVSGISYRRILVPVIGLGLALTIIMIVLTQWVIPVFWTLILQTIQTDVTKMFQASISRGEPFAIGRMQVYADEMAVYNNPEGDDGPETRLVLFKVAAADIDKSGKVATDVTAARAIVDVYRREGETMLKMAMSDTVALNAETGQLVYSERFSPRRAITVPISLDESPKGLTRRRLLELRKNPDGFITVNQARESLAEVIRDVELRRNIDSQLRDVGELNLTSENPGDSQRRYSIRAERIEAQGRFVAHTGGKIEVHLIQDDVPALRFTADAAQLVRAEGTSLDTPMFDLLLGKHEVMNLTSPAGGANVREGLVIPNLRLTGQPDVDWSSRGGAELLQLGKRLEARHSAVRKWMDGYLAAVHKLHHEINARLLNRYALSITALLLLLLGSTLAMLLRGTLPLTIYVLAFVPSILDLILISAGEQLLRDGKMWGHAVMWSGNSILLLMLIVAFWKLARH